MVEVEVAEAREARDLGLDLLEAIMEDALA